MKKNRFMLISIILFAIMLIVIIGCPTKNDKKIFVKFDSRSNATVEVGGLYLFPVVLDDGNGPMKFDVIDSPKDSVLVNIDGKNYIQWRPKKKGVFAICIGKDYFQQSYEITVVDD